MTCTIFPAFNAGIFYFFLFYIREPLIKSKITQRDLKRAVARRSLPLMAVVLNKNFNAENVRLRPRPPGPPHFSLVFVVLFRLNPLGFQKHALTRKKWGGLSDLGLNQRFLRLKKINKNYKNNLEKFTRDHYL